MKPLLICNPGSRAGRSRRLCMQVLDAFERAGVSCDHVFTRSLDDAQHLSHTANRGGRKTIVAVGGDGTINRVMNGFYDREGKRIASARLGVVHTGTSPDFCRSYGIPTELKSAVRAIGEGNTGTILPGRVEYRNGQRQSRSAVFGCWANIGVGPMLARAANGGIRGILGDMLGSFIALLYVLGRYRPSDFAVRCDESERVHRQVINIAIGRTRYIASGMKVDRTLDMQDAGLHVLIIKNLTPTRIPRVLSQLYRGDIRSDCESVFLTRGKHVTLFAGRRETELEFDGDPRGQLPCTITAAEPLDIIGANLS